ncbi:MAG: 50S ribosomal protein L6 [Actinobacteria bacterium]|nr:50S ribosomal protein L6 [Actinomycetota bacterium]MDI6831075.1 50S ribosomal protein L6 [Actinomycetota bacterium]
MSRIGRAPITVPPGTEVRIEGNRVTVKGPKGELTREFHPEMIIEMEEDRLLVKRPSDVGFHRSLHGLTRSLLANMVEGVTSGFEKNLEIHGVGYRAVARDRDIELSLGFSHPVLVKAPEGIEFEVVTPTKLRIKGIDKQQVGQMAAKIRALRKPDPYKGKGVRYAGEQIRRKAGKTSV